MKNLYITGLLLLIVSSIAMAAPVGSQFSYQGKLNDNGSPANGTYDFWMMLWSTETVGTGSELSPALFIDDVSVVNGLFTLELDFGDAPFNGEDSFLQINVREGSLVGSYAALNPRPRINAVPYAIQSEFVENGSSPWTDFAGGISYPDDVTIGTLTNTSPSKVTIQAGSGTEPFRARIGSTTRFLLTANGGAVVGVNGTSPDAGLYVEGDANQALSSHGFVKAGVVIECGAGINGNSIRFFNNVNGSDFTTTQNGAGGGCAIDTPFPINDLFYTVSANFTGGTQVFQSVNASCSVSSNNNNRLSCQLNLVSSAGVTTQNGILQILFY